MQASSHHEKLLSGLGGGLSILVVFWLTSKLEMSLGVQLLFVASMGASAVLLFAAPHGPLSQPWNVIGGHLVSALVGETAHQFIDNPFVAGAIGVGLAITAMYYLKCLHPPGGATALVAVIGGPSVESFGYLYALFPIGFGAVAMVLVAVAFNYPMKWRRYPQSLAPAIPAPVHDEEYPDISHANLVAAIAEIDTYVDISEQDLLRIYETATSRSHPELAGEKQADSRE